ncbi:hypothetical protein N657DRAFT_186668 [Parathielavia appendiculata]|uniref:Uncharacterized protein n=1 Tax=Parathielavia appendiculata TaxID=2587402 RepID=A0AAN6U8K5_9PEZI|nr:hypothetical protein N657DRAFT_186668 [Parathielavia appendiculata]
MFSNKNRNSNPSSHTSDAPGVPPIMRVVEKKVPSPPRHKCLSLGGAKLGKSLDQRHPVSIDVEQSHASTTCSYDNWSRRRNCSSAANSSSIGIGQVRSTKSPPPSEPLPSPLSWLRKPSRT